MTSPFRLETFWKPAEGGDSLSYALRLTNRSDRTVSGFKLCVSGPARIDPAATIEGGALTARLSNHSEFTPPPGTELAPGASWTLTARGLSYPLRHWTDGATTAYLALADGSTAPVAVAPTPVAHAPVVSAPVAQPAPQAVAAASRLAELLAVAEADRLALSWVIAAASGQRLRQLNGGDRQGRMALAPDGARLVLARGGDAPELVVLDDPRCIELMRRFVEEHPHLWNEDIGR